MQYLSVRDFFNRLQNKSNTYILLPTGIFLLYFVLVGFGKIQIKTFVTGDERLFFWNFPVCTVILMIISHYLVNKKIKKIPSDIGLGLKLEKLGDLYNFRLYLVCGLTSGVALSLYIWNDSRIGFIFVALLTWHFILLPRPFWVVKHLRLRGDERKMIESKGAYF